MKKTLILVFLAFATASFAQSVELGANYGFTNYSIHNTNYYNGNYSNFQFYQSSVMAPVSTVSAVYRKGHYQFGASVGYQQFSYTSRQYPVPLGFADQFPTFYHQYETPVALLANRTFSYHHFQFYCGLHATYVLDRTDYIFIGLHHTDNNRMAGGAQGGVTYYVTRHLGINAQIDADLNNFPSGPLDKNTISIPVAAGIRYRISI